MVNTQAWMKMGFSRPALAEAREWDRNGLAQHRPQSYLRAGRAEATTSLCMRPQNVGVGNLWALWVSFLSSSRSW